MSFSAEDDDAFLPASSLTQSSEHLHHGVHTRHTSGTTRTSGSQYNRMSGDWSTRLSTSGPSVRRDSLPPTRTGLLKPEDHPKVDPLRLVKPDSNPLANQALETINAMEKQKQIQKEMKEPQQQQQQQQKQQFQQQPDSPTGTDWEKNLLNWKDRRKSKSSYQPKALELQDDQDAIEMTGKRSKTFKELMQDKEKRSNGHGKYIYETEQSPSSETTTTKITTTTRSYHSGTVPETTTLTSITTRSTALSRETPGLDPIEAPSKTSARDYSSASLVERRVERDTGTVHKQPQEINIEFQVKPETRTVETKEVVRKSMNLESLRPHDSDSDTDKKRWTPTVRQKPEITTTITTSTITAKPATPTPTSTLGVKLREKPAGPSQPRPYSYAYTSTSTGISDAHARTTKPPERTFASSQVTGSSRETVTLRSVDRSANPSAPPPGPLNKDRRVKSNWELNFGQGSDFKPTQKTGTDGASSAKFKQTLSMFQSKETGTDQPAPKSQHQTLSTQRSVGRISRVPEEISKPALATHVGSDLRRGSAAAVDRSYSKPTTTTDIKSGYQTDSSRLREFSRSAHGLDTQRSELGKSSILDRDWKYGNGDDKSSLRKYETSQYTTKGTSSSVETGSSKGSMQNIHSSEDEGEKGKTTGKLDKGETGSRTVRKVELEVTLPTTGFEVRKHGNQHSNADLDSKFVLTTRPRDEPSESKVTIELSSQKTKHSEHIAPLESQPYLVSATTRTISNTSEVGQPLSGTNRYSRVSDSIRPGVKSTHLEDSKFKTTTTADVKVPDWRTDQKSSSARKEINDSNDPKSLYAYKYRSTNTEESVVKDSNTVPGSYSIDLQPKPVSGIEALQRSKSNQSSFISDMFSKRSAAAIKGKSPENDYDSSIHTKTSTTLEHTIPKSRSVYEKEEIKQHHDEVKPRNEPLQYGETTKTKTEITVTGRRVVSDVRGNHDEEQIRKADDNTARPLKEPYGVGHSSRRNQGLERSTDYTLGKAHSRSGDGSPDRKPGKLDEPLKEKTFHHDLKQQSAFEVNFTSSEVGKPRFVGGMDTGKSETLLLGQEGIIEFADPKSSEHSRFAHTSERKEEAKHIFAESKARPTQFEATKLERDSDTSDDDEKTDNKASIHSKTHTGEFLIELDTKNFHADKRKPDTSLPLLTEKDSSKLQHKLEESMVLDFHEPAVSKHHGIDAKIKHSETEHKIVTQGPSHSVKSPPHHEKPSSSPPSTMSPIHKPPHSEERPTSRPDRSPSPEERTGFLNQKSLIRETSHQKPPPPPQRAISPDRRSSSPEDRAISPIEMLLPPTGKAPPVPRSPSPEERSISPIQTSLPPTGRAPRVSRSPSPEDRSISPIQTSLPPTGRAPRVSRSPSPEERAISPMEMLLPPTGKAPAPPRSPPPKERAGSPTEKSPSPKRRASSPGSRSPSPKGRAISPIEMLPPPKGRAASPVHRTASPIEKTLPPLPVSRPPGDRDVVPSRRSPSPDERPPPPIQASFPPGRRRSPSPDDTSSRLIELVHVEEKSKDGKRQTSLDSHSSDEESVEGYKQKKAVTDVRRIDLNSNVSTDTSNKFSASRPSSILSDEFKSRDHHDKTSHGTKVASEVKVLDHHGIPKGEGDIGVTIGDREPVIAAAVPSSNVRDNSPPKKKPPPEPPKTKPKPSTQNSNELRSPPEKDDFSFLAGAELLDTSANLDKCRLAKSGQMAGRRRPKSAFFPSAETGDLFGSSFESDSSIGKRHDDSDDARPDAAPVSNGLDPVLRPAVSQKSKATARPLSYMGELNSSLAKKFKDEADDAADSGAKSSRSFQKSSFHSSREEREDGSTKTTVVSGSSSEERSTHMGGVKVPGLLGELNSSFKKKGQEKPQLQSHETEASHARPHPPQKSDSTSKVPSNSTGAVPTGDLLSLDNDDADAGPPPLPNAPPPLPNWNSFPSDGSGPPPSGPPPPPSGPPPLLIDFGFDDSEDSGRIEIRTETHQTQARGQTWWEDDNIGKSHQTDA